ncbi:ParB N-terminal domain-containing protein [Rhizobium herbae]|uniref:ParB N-terminal domain-containing protein n=1 Tax=Rhizobium herbae TaxID=508661 RepID=A0ABS7HD35_9HYPH|nr:hypothetical protein [Rhizobium herbae]MBW9064789.1 ParB N-terminal domain-containing protein [Rhizobium herbae]
MKYRLLPLDSLIPTEDVDVERVFELEDQIVQSGCWKVPITVHRDALFVMDGHHRLTVAKRLRLELLPVVLLDYDSVHVEAWRPGETITPESIFVMVRSGDKFPCKTTGHVFAHPIPECAIPLSDLRRAPRNPPVDYLAGSNRTALRSPPRAEA